MRFFAAFLSLASTTALGAAEQPSGLDLFVRAEKGNCIACHQLAQGAGPATRADVGPLLEGSRMRSLGKASLRDTLVDPMRANPDTIMPPYGRHRLLDPAEIDRLVEFLLALP